MKKLKPLLYTLGIAASLLLSPAQATEPVVIVHGEAAAGTTSTFSLRNEAQSSCNSPSVGDCSNCSVACPVGEAAVCQPGKVLAATGDGSCQREPSCRCINAHEGTTTRP